MKTGVIKKIFYLIDTCSEDAKIQMKILIFQILAFVLLVNVDNSFDVFSPS